MDFYSSCPFFLGISILWQLWMSCYSLVVSDGSDRTEMAGKMDQPKILSLIFFDAINLMP
jgi:hypothetical protein